MSRNILKSSLLNAGFSIIFQILCRLVTFGINAFVVRNVGREVLGIMNVRLLLLESTLIFLSREAINRAALSATSQQREKCSWPQLINQMWLTVPICIILSIPCLHIWIHMLSPVNTQYIEQYKFATYAVAMSVIVELCAEAPVFVTQVFCFVKLKIFLNTLHIFVRSIVFLWIVIGNESITITAFATAQIVSSLVILMGHYWFFQFYIMRFNSIRKQRKSNYEESNQIDRVLFENMEDFPFTKLTDMLPGFMENTERAFNNELQILTLSFLKQGVLKQILTEGEKYVMSVSPVLNFSEQATYDVVNNLGSLAARFIFRPIEENSYFYFTQTISRDVELYKQDRAKVQQAGKVLSYISKVVTSIGWLTLIFGQNYSYTLLLLYGGPNFVDGGLPEKLLRWHCLAICFLAVNGITEGYMFATNTNKDIDKYNYLMAIFSISFLVLSYIFTSIFGAVGFILANCINMFCRICYSILFIWKEFKTVNYNPLLGLVPGKYFLTTVLIVGVICKHLMASTQSILWHIIFGFIGVIISLVIWMLENLDLVKLALSYRHHIKVD